MTLYGPRRRVAPWLLATAVVVSLGIGAGVGVIASRRGRATGPTTTSTPVTTAAGAASTLATTANTAAPPALTVQSVTPANNAVGVSASSSITVAFSAPLAATSPTPSLSPTVPGAWHVSGSQAIFVPSAPMLPLTELTVDVPAGPTGVVAVSGGELATAFSSQFRIQDGSVLRLQQLLSLLGYSPLSWAPTGPAIATDDEAAEAQALYDPPAGTFAWSEKGWPARLRALWHPGADDVFTRGLVMSFQADHGLTPNGHVGPGLWANLVSALQSGTLNSGGYDYALANKATPESFTVWHDGRVVVRGPANTGIAGAPTADGTFPVFTRLRSQVMRGTNPDGAHYADLVQYIAYFNGNDAVHYMDRSDYGIPQSLGCVELPLAEAAQAWPYLAYGTLVTVIN